MLICTVSYPFSSDDCIHFVIHLPGSVILPCECICFCFLHRC